MISYYLLLVDDDQRDDVAYIYNYYYKYMRDKAESMVDDESSCEDIVHDAMLKIIKNIAAINTDDKNKLKNLCILITEHTAHDFLRKKDNGYLPLEDVEVYTSDDTYHPEKILLEKVSVELIVEAIYHLSPIYRMPCELKYLYGYKEREIASLLDLTPKAVNARIFRGKRLLRKYIEDAVKKTQ